MFLRDTNLGEIIINKRKIFYLFSILIVSLSVFLFVINTPKLSIEFTGGAYYEVSCKNTCIKKEELNNLIKNKVDSVDIILKDNGYIIRTPPINQSQKIDIEKIFGEQQLDVDRFSIIGPSIGSELKYKASIAIAVVVLLIIVFIAFVFKEVSKPVPSFVYGIVAIIALVHDVVVPAGFYSVLGSFGAEIDTLFVVAMLAILGYSVNDTIVIFDRTRERLKYIKDKKIKEPFEKTVAEALNSSFARSINTSLTTILALLSIYFLGPDVVKNFALVLIMGAIAGTYSSLFLATPLIVSYFEYKKSKDKEEKKQVS